MRLGRPVAAIALLVALGAAAVGGSAAAASASPSASASFSAGASAAAEASASAEAPAEPCRTVPAPAAGLLRADEVAARLGVDGTGVRVGIISDSFDTGVVPTASDDVAAGVLPGPGNPCGWETPVEVVAESPGPDSDEGRAMAQVVHGIAPGATLLFAATVDTNAGVASAIEKLLQAEVDIIVDDVGAADDLVFQKGEAGAAVDKAVDAGVLYVSAAGNFGEVGAAGYPSAGHPISAWSTSSYRPTSCPPEVVAAVETATGSTVVVDCNDFDPGVAVDPRLTATVAAGIGVPMSFFWAEPVGSVTTRFGLALTLPETGQVEFGWAPDPQMPRVSGGVPGIASTPAPRQLSIVREVTTTAAAPAVAFVFEGNGRTGSLAALDYFRSVGDDVVGSTLKGHQADPSTIAVAAVDAETLTLETYSSAGPATTLIGVPEPTVVDGPAVTGLDGLPISFDLDGAGPTFYGTSAAAPSVAAVAALVLQASPGADPAAVREALSSTARPDAFSSPYDRALPAERFTGAGLVDAFAAVSAVIPPTPPTPSPTPTPAPAAPTPAPSTPAPSAALAATGAPALPLAPVALGGVLALAAGVVARMLVTHSRRRSG